LFLLVFKIPNKDVFVLDSDMEFGASLEYSSQWCDNRFLDSKERFIKNMYMWDT